MTVRAVIGGQWGDEGKGKMIDILSENANIVARFQGGANAGHTINVDGEETILHQIPSGILRSGVDCVLGNGMVVDPVALAGEIDELKSKGVDIDGRINISLQAHVVTPIHKYLDAAYEKERGEDSIGTTQRGIGPCYSEKIDRSGIRIRDLNDLKKVKKQVNKKIELCEKRNLLDKEGKDNLEGKLEKFYTSIKKIKKYQEDTINFLHKAIDADKNILIEGAQGTLLDIDFGSFPYVTSSNTTTGNVFSGLGLNPSQIGDQFGIFKAYLTRVGKGPFPTELDNKVGEKLRNIGDEFGATTGRRRRCGWLDLELASYSIKINGFDSIVLTKLDVLDKLDKIKVCTGYKQGSYPKVSLKKAKPEITSFKGWDGSVKGIRKFANLPDNAKKYVNFIEEQLDAQISHISVGKNRKQLIKK